jgi:hypothetical protein
MNHEVKGTLFIISLNELDSSFINQIVYDAKTEVLSVILRNESVYNYEKVPMDTFLDFSVSNSFGSYYNSNIKNKFNHLKLQSMAEKNGNQPNRINKASKEKRYIRMSLDVTKIKKDWFYISKNDDGSIKSVYLKMTLAMLPDGEVDKFGQLGFVIQDVPQEISKAEKDLPKNEKSRGAILGNAEELEWTKQEEKLERVTENDTDIMDDLPF